MNNNRKTPRADFINYDAGYFFVTVCTADKKHYFGSIVKGENFLTPIGEFADHQLKTVSNFKNNISIPLHVVMPNHIHFMIRIQDNGDLLNMPNDQRNPNPSYRSLPMYKRHVTELAKYMTSLKSSVTKFANKIGTEFKWQSRYHDHYIRGNNDGHKIYNYILTNVENWHKDCFYE